jgi:hypothetical protein
LLGILTFIRERLEHGLNGGRTMKRKTLAEKQSIGVLKEAGAKTANLVRRQGWL